jgi:hypothetical protein
MDRDMFRVASENNIHIYTGMMTELIRKCIWDVVPTVMIKTYPNFLKVDRWHDSHKPESENHHF